MVIRILNMMMGKNNRKNETQINTDKNAMNTDKVAERNSGFRRKLLMIRGQNFCDCYSMRVIVTKNWRNKKSYQSIKLYVIINIVIVDIIMLLAGRGAVLPFGSGKRVRAHRLNVDGKEGGL